MKLDYSEFTFGYAFTENFLRRAPTGHPAPVFPNLSQEASLGYDVRINLPAAPLFFQFKLAELMIRNSAREISRLNIPNLVTPYFRFAIMPRRKSQQHELLVHLETMYPKSVLYAAPKQKNKSSLDKCYIKGQIYRCSALICPGDIGFLSDDRQHWIVYHPRAKFGWFCSEPREVRFFDIDQWEERLPERFKAEYQDPLSELVKRMLQALLGLWSSPMRDAEQGIRHAVRARLARLDERWLREKEIRAVVEALLVCRDIARIGLGLELIIAQPGSSRGV